MKMGVLGDFYNIPWPVPEGKGWTHGKRARKTIPDLLGICTLGAVTPNIFCILIFGYGIRIMVTTICS